MSRIQKLFHIWFVDFPLLKSGISNCFRTPAISFNVLCFKNRCGFSSKIEVECGSLEDAVEAATAGAEVVMLDNMEPEFLKKQAKTLKQRFPALIIEASGNIRPNTLAPYLSPDVDIVSMSLQQGYGAVDFSLKIQPKSKL